MKENYQFLDKKNFKWYLFNYLHVRKNEVSNFSLESSRVAAGHPEGFFEAFANIYTEFADSIINKKKSINKNTYPNIQDGVKGIKFIFAAKKSSNNNSRWIKL